MSPAATRQENVSQKTRYRDTSRDRPTDREKRFRGRFLLHDDRGVVYLKLTVVEDLLIVSFKEKDE